MTKNNMYSLNVKSWNPFVGCKFGCIYCKNSFQAQLKRWAKKNCQKCYNFEPHEHPERLDCPMPKTGYMQFIFTCASGDVSFCSTTYLQDIVQVIERWPDRTFLIQSKNPITFARIAKWPNNVILGTTLETDVIYKGYYSHYSTAPYPYIRYKDFSQIKHSRKMITIEPIIEFGDELQKWIQNLNPCMVWIGYDSKNNKLPEPPIEKVRELHWQLSKMGIVVMLKELRVQEMPLDN